MDETWTKKSRGTVKRNILHAAVSGSQPGMGMSCSGVFLFQLSDQTFDLFW
jgi:hypothetical protein